MIPTELFHYTSANTAIEKILLNQQIKVGLIKYVNDPRESKDWALLPKLTGIPTNSLPLKEVSVNQEFTRIKQEEWKAVCFATSDPKYERHPKSTLDEGFLYGACKPRMWANYAENHKGVCLKFNGPKFDKQIRINSEKAGKNRRTFCGKVKYFDYGDTLDSVSIDYTELSKVDVSQGLRHHLIRYYKKFFLMKSKDWKTESEFRWLVYDESKEVEFLPIKGIVEEVIVGFDFLKVYYPTLVELCRPLDIRIRKIIWSNGFPCVSDYN
jgi:hypothetical protein